MLGDDVSIWSNTVIDYGTVIGDGVKIHCNCYVAQYTEIGEGAFLAPGVSIANDLYPGAGGLAGGDVRAVDRCGRPARRERDGSAVRPDRRGSHRRRRFGRDT